MMEPKEARGKWKARAEKVSILPRWMIGSKGDALNDLVLLVLRKGRLELLEEGLGL